MRLIPHESHGYFVSAPASVNNALRELFAQAFGGGRAEAQLEYAADLNVYRLR